MLTRIGVLTRVGVLTRAGVLTIVGMRERGGVPARVDVLPGSKPREMEQRES